MKWFEKCKPFAAMLAINFCFAIANVLYKVALSQGLSYLVIITYRQLIALLLLAPLGYLLERESWSTLTSRVIWGLFSSAIVGPVLTSYLFLAGLKYNSATLASAFANVMPVTTFIMALCFRLEKLSVKSKSGKAKLLGSIICIAGALILLFYKGMPAINNHASKNDLLQKTNYNIKDRAIGSIFLTLALLTWSSWFLIQAKIGKSYPFPYSSTAIMCFFSAIQSTILNLAIDRNVSVWILKGPLQISTMFYAGMIAAGMCYVVMCWCIKVKGPVFSSAFTPFLQIFVAIFDAFLLHETIHLGSILGSLVVIVGMYVLLWGKSFEDKICPQILQQEEKGGNGNSIEPQVTITVSNGALKT